jgi:hypothetical protein
LRKSIITAGTALSLSLAVAGAAQADTGVQSLTGDWSATNSTVTKVADGVHFGIYADGGANGGSVIYRGANGLKLSDVNDFGYTFNYREKGETKGAAPYARIYLDGNGDGVADDDVVYDPSLGGVEMPTKNEELTRQMVGGSVRYNDDPASGPQADWADVVALHGDEKIVKVAVTQGFSTGADVSAMLRNVTFNGEKFNFDVAPADGQNGSDGQDGKDGVDGTNGVNGTNGANGAAGKDGVTTIVYVDPTKLYGNTMRAVHAPKVKGWKFVKVRASLRGKRLHTHHRTIKVDLRKQGVGTYKVRMKMHYKDSSGDVHTVRSIRTLSITRS